MQRGRWWKSFEIAAGADDHYVEESWPMSHGETVIVVVIISIGIVIVIVILLIVTKMITTVIIPILTSLRMWVSRDGLFSLGKASKVIQPPTIPCIAFACAAFKSHSASYVRSDPPYYTIAICLHHIELYSNILLLQIARRRKLHNCCKLHWTHYFVLHFNPSPSWGLPSAFLISQLC